MLDWPDWIWWTSAGAFGALAALGLYLSLFRDRARGRERCPKCWYDMAGPRAEGAGRRCPECGYKATTDRAWLRTKRRWRWSAIGFVLLVLTIASLSMPHYRRHGWAYYLPDRMLVWAYPRFDPPRVVRPWSTLTRPIQMEISLRLEDDEMSSGSRQALVRLLKGWLGDDVTPQHRLEALRLLEDLHPESVVLLDEMIEIWNASGGTYPDNLTLRSIACFAWEEMRAESVIVAVLDDPNPDNSILGMLAVSLPKTPATIDRTIMALNQITGFFWMARGDLAHELSWLGSSLAPYSLTALERASDPWAHGISDIESDRGARAALAVLRGEAASLAEFYSRRLFLSDLKARVESATFLYNMPSQFTPETINNIERSLRTETEWDVLNELIILILNAPVELRSMKPALIDLKRRFQEDASAVEDIDYALDHIRYPNRRR